MRVITFVKQNPLQRITTDTVMQRMSDLQASNFKQILSYPHGLRNGILSGGTFTLVSGMVLKVDRNTFMVKRKTETEMNIVHLVSDIEVTITPETSGSDRIDLIEGKISETLGRRISNENINELGSTTYKNYYNVDNKIGLTVRVVQGTTATNPIAVDASNKDVANFINDGIQGDFEINLIKKHLDLSTLYNIKFSIDSGENFYTIDCRGGTAAATTKDDIINTINNTLQFKTYEKSGDAKTFTSSGTTVIINSTLHGLSQGQYIIIDSSNNTSYLEDGIYKITEIVDTNNFTITATGGGSGTCNWTFKIAVKSNGYIRIQTNDVSKTLDFQPPASADATEKILGLVEDSDYYYTFDAQYEWFKLGEVYVTSGDTSLSQFSLRDVTRIKDWSNINTNENDPIIVDNLYTKTINQKGAVLDWRQFGVEKTIAGITTATESHIAAMNNRLGDITGDKREQTIAFYDSDNDALQTYKLDQFGKWQTEGSALTITTAPSEVQMVSASNPNLSTTEHIIYFANFNTNLKYLYSFNASTGVWAGVGFTASITYMSSLGNVACMPIPVDLSSPNRRFVEMDYTAGKLFVANYVPGVGWGATPTGYTLPFTVTAGAKICALDAIRIAIIEISNKTLRVMEYRESDVWVQIGNVFTDSSFVSPLPITLSSTRISVIDKKASNNFIKVYNFDGTDWRLAGIGPAVTANSATPAGVALTSTRIACHDTTDNELKMFDMLDIEKGGNPPSPAFS